MVTPEVVHQLHNRAINKIKIKSLNFHHILKGKIFIS
jgi:hypothetical protein